MGCATPETIVGLPGIGQLVVNNISGQHSYDLPTLVVLITIVNMLADITGRALDPRARLEQTRAR